MTTSQTDKFGGIKTIKGEATGFFHLEKTGDREWFMDPEGCGFFPVGISHSFSSDSEVTVKEHYNYDQKKWMDDWIERYLELGFNSAPAGGASPCRDKRGYVDLEYAEEKFIEKGLPFTTGIWQFPHPVELRFQYERQDIFSNYYSDLVGKRAETACGRHKDNPLLFGYCYGFGGFIDMSSWINSIASSHANSAGRTAIADILIERHKDDLSRFNSLYGTNCASLEDLKTTETIRFGPEFNKQNPATYDKTDPVKRGDFEAISDAFAVQAYRVGHAAIRQHDRRHVIIGMYVKAANFAPELWKKVAPTRTHARPSTSIPSRRTTESTRSPTSPSSSRTRRPAIRVRHNGSADVV